MIAMIGMIVGNAFNIIFDPIMILSFGWDVAGAAIATVLGNFVSAAIYLFHLLSSQVLVYPMYQNQLSNQQSMCSRY